MSKRLTPAEKAGFRKYAAYIGSDSGPFPVRYRITPPEPALGSLDERLAIIIKRQGGRVGPIRLTGAERAELASYQDHGAYEEQELAA